MLFSVSLDDARHLALGAALLAPLAPNPNSATSERGASAGQHLRQSDCVALLELDLNRFKQVNGSLSLIARMR
ncbi:hypothetical protein [Sodalis sp.]|uniref:hypothetical protein n=1 Tax=Sodalis sp. (in: enterobacteria) TaxID=1898979 RepID=UPI003872ADE7